MYRIILIVSWFVIPLFSITGCLATDNDDIIFQDDFNTGRIDESRWELTFDGNFAEAEVDVADVNPDKDIDYRLILRADTIGTSHPLKYLGVRSKTLIDFTEGTEIAFDLDWNNQTNGSYLTSALYLSPTVSNNPKNEDDWLKFEYVGVPPGKNVRISIWEKVEGVGYPVHTDWGPDNDQGKPLGLPLGSDVHRIRLILDENQLRVLQDNEEIFSNSEHNLNFTTAYLYLQMSSGTNYHSRELYFDNITVQSASLSGQEQ
ncbi:hypothetical protein ACFLWL_00885 [Chloroflexota bacterium]